MNRKILADCYHDVANKWYHERWWDSGNDTHIQKAIDYTKKAFDLKIEQNNLEEDSLEKTSFNLGVFYHYKGNVYEAIDSYLFLIQNGLSTDLIQDAKLELGALYMELGDFYKALNQLTEIISSQGVSEENFYTNLVDAYILKAETYSLMDVQEYSTEIRTNLRKADSLIQQSNEPDFSFKSLRIDQLEGNLLLQTKNYKEAIYSHRKMLRDTINLYPEDLAIVNNSLAFSQLKLKNHTLAFTHLKDAISLDDNYSSPYENLGDLYLAQDNFESALFNYQKAIVWAIDKRKEVKIDDLFDIHELELASNKILVLNHIVTKANGWLKYYEYDNNMPHLDHALKTFALADQLVDIIRSESTEQQSKLFWREKGASLYTSAVGVCYLLNKPEEAYYFMERNKALLLLEDISNEQAKKIAKLPKAMAKREFELKRAIFLAENDFKNFDTTSPDSPEIVKREVYKKKQLYNTFVDSLTKAFPEYARIKKKVDILPYKDFKTTYISEDEVILQYILNDEQGYGLLTTEDETLFFKLPAIESLNEKIVALYSQLTDLTSNRDKMKSYNSLSNEVFRQLIPENVYKKISGKKLLVITDYVLQQIPFEAFVVENEKSTYLIEETEIRYAYSISYLQAKKRVSSDAKKELFAIAPVQFASLSLPELVFSSAEVGEAEKIFSGKLALNTEATKGRFIENIEDTKILHLSTHADIGEGIDPWIAFSDEKMFLNEIYATKNQAEMVVLSACNTSVGELRKGEGAMSLARGFFHSGAKSVVSSLWSTNDKSSQELMTAFYKGLDKGLTKGEALRRAKIDYINKYRSTTISPSYWAALIVIGDNSPMTTSVFNSANLVWVIVGSGLFVFLALFFFKRGKIQFNS